MMFKAVIKDRRVWLAVLILALVAFVTRRAVPAEWGFAVVIHAGYWFTLALVLLWGRAVWKSVKSVGWGKWLGWPEAGVAALILVVTGMWIAHERPGYKVLADELLLSGTAMSMHYDRQAAYPVRATDVQGSFQILSRVLDKRPLVFPFLVTTVHDTTGYRPENAFYVNMVLAVAFLAAVYALARKAGGGRGAGILGVLLFAGLPLMAQQSTGGGFELLNLLLLTVYGLLMIRYLEAPDEVRLEAFILCAVMLASTRYESAVFLAPAAIVALCGWWRAKRVILSWPLITAAVFLVPVLLQNRMFDGGSKAWEMASQGGVTEPFGFQYLAPNLGHALVFFFDFSGYQANSPVFAGAGLIALPIWGMWIIRVLRQRNSASGRDQALAWIGVGLLGVTAVYMFYFWGKFDDGIISRLSLPVHLLMMLATVSVCSMFIKTGAGWRWAAGVAAAGLLAVGLPILSRQAYRTLYSPGMEMLMRQDFLTKQEDRNLLFIDNDPFFWILQKMASTPVMQVKSRKDALVYHLRNHSFREMYVFQNIKVNDQTGERSVDPVDDLGPDFELETVWERRVQTLLFARISRIKAIKEKGVTQAEASPLVPVLQETRSRAELERARLLYMENWLKQLP